MTVSEKAISTASRNIVDESKIKPSLTEVSCKILDTHHRGYMLGPLCHLIEETHSPLSKIERKPIVIARGD